MYSKAASTPLRGLLKQVASPATIFMASIMLVNGGNYLYNIILGRWLGPAAFAEAGLIITLLLIFSFLGMTFQITATKFRADLPDKTHQKVAIQWLSNRALYSGLALSVLLIASAGPLSTWFRLEGSASLICFALALPAYFIMSVSRGSLQAVERYYQLSGSYLSEMAVRLLLTPLLIILLQMAGTGVSIAITGSVLAGLFAMGMVQPWPGLSAPDMPVELRKSMVAFFGVTAGYEVVQIAINYGDLLLVKHYFGSQEAGLYTSMALVGRMIYFVAWMLVMVMVPSILKKRANKEPFLGTFYRKVGLIAIVCAGMVSGTWLFPKLAVSLLFGEAYMAIAPYLWMYALATSLFAIANLFVYLCLTLDRFRPVLYAGIMAVIQLVLYTFFHESFYDVLTVQIVCMGLLLIIQLTYFTYHRKRL